MAGAGQNPGAPQSDHVRAPRRSETFGRPRRLRLFGEDRGMHYERDRVIAGPEDRTIHETSLPINEFRRRKGACWRIPMAQASSAARKDLEKSPTPAKMTVSLHVNGVERQLLSLIHI